MLQLFVSCQFQKILPRFMFTQVHTARWIWDFVVIGALLWVTTFTPLQVVEKRHAIRRGIYDMECGYALVVRITRSLWWCALTVVDCIFVWGLWSCCHVSCDKAIRQHGILVDQLANVVCVHVCLFRVRVGGQGWVFCVHVWVRLPLPPQCPPHTTYNPIMHSTGFYSGRSADRSHFLGRHCNILPHELSRRKWHRSIRCGIDCSSLPEVLT